jgi:hypothetical protein
VSEASIYQKIVEFRRVGMQAEAAALHPSSAVLRAG